MREKNQLLDSQINEVRGRHLRLVSGRGVPQSGKGLQQLLECAEKTLVSFGAGRPRIGPFRIGPRTVIELNLDKRVHDRNFVIDVPPKGNHASVILHPSNKRYFTGSEPPNVIKHAVVAAAVSASLGKRKRHETGDEHRLRMSRIQATVFLNLLKPDNSQEQD